MSNITSAFEEAFPDIPLKVKLFLEQLDYFQLDGVKYRVVYDDWNTFLLKKETGTNE